MFIWINKGSYGSTLYAEQITEIKWYVWNTIFETLQHVSTGNPAEICPGVYLFKIGMFRELGKLFIYVTM